VVTRLLLFGGLVKYLGKRLDLAPVINLCLIEFQLETFQLFVVRLFLEAGGVIVWLKGAVDVSGLVHEVEYKGVFLTRNFPVKPDFLLALFSGLDFAPSCFLVFFVAGGKIAEAALFIKPDDPLRGGLEV
jgi:hypothetical protein